MVKVGYQHAQLSEKRQGCTQNRYLASSQGMHTKTQAFTSERASGQLKKCAVSIFHAFFKAENFTNLM